MNHRLTVIFGLMLACSMMLSVRGKAASDTSSTSTTKNFKTYGKCSVYDKVDMFTDEIRHLLSCRDSHITDETVVLFFVDRNREFLNLSKGTQFIFEDKVDVAIRVDQGKLRRGNWYYEDDIAVSSDQTLIPALLDEIAKGDRVVIKVGKEGGNIPLKGSAAAVADYKARVAQSKKLWSRSKTPRSTNKSHEGVKKDAEGTFLSSCEQTISANDAMKFDTKELKIDGACKTFKLTLKHTGRLPITAMGHNLVIAEDSKMDEVIQAGIKAGAAKGYIPDSADVLVATKLLGGGESDTTMIEVAKLEGKSLSFFCLFPGHTTMMRGKVTVGKKGSPERTSASSL